MCLIIRLTFIEDLKFIQIRSLGCKFLAPLSLINNNKKILNVILETFFKNEIEIIKVIF